MHRSLILSAFTLFCSLDWTSVEANKCPFGSPKYASKSLSSSVVHLRGQSSSSGSVQCVPSKYRSMNGSCNNLQNPSWGQAKQPFRRLLNPDYSDSVSASRVAKSGQQLPNSRLVSRTVFTTDEEPHLGLSNLFSQFALFLTFDTQTTHRPSAVGCCTDHWSDPECTPVVVSTDDPFYSKHNVACLPFRRASPVFINGVRNHLNLATAFIDGSPIYGNSEATSNTLRSFIGGKLRTSPLAGGHEDDLPKDENGTNACFIPKSEDVDHKKCFLTGDSRANLQVGVTLMHSLWLKEHNRVATILGQLNPNWSDEILFQESRKIVGAQLQHITYKEFLPLILSRPVMNATGLTPQKAGYTHSYDPKLDPSVSSAFSTAVFRLHSYIHGLVELIDDDGVVTQVRLSDTYNNPSLLYGKSGQKQLIRGLLHQNAHKFGMSASNEIQEQLLRKPGTKWGTDLIMLDIERGRDHGIPGYNAFRSLCGLPKIKDFNDLEKYVDPMVAQVVAKLYESVDDIDLYIGAMAEKPAHGTHYGNTSLCIMNDQFSRLKKGDRFWYENDCQATGDRACFNLDQLKEIRKSSLAKVICDNSDIKVMPKKALLNFGTKNVTVSCSRIAGPDLRKWISV